MPALTKVMLRATEPPVHWREARGLWMRIRAEHDFVGYRPLLTPPSANLKLAKGERPAYGLTLQHHVSRFDGLLINACPWAGQCTKVCVLDNGHGHFPSVQRARRAKTEFFARHPKAAVALVAHELELAVRRHGPILFRPNVNSDVDWLSVAPGWFDIMGVTAYGYTKDPSILDGDGWVHQHYRLSYSFNENSDWEPVNRFLAHGGSVAVVTNRRPKTGITQWHPLTFPVVVDADQSDEWMFDSSVIGDLAFKARGGKKSNRGPKGFVQQIYEEA